MLTHFGGSAPNNQMQVIAHLCSLTPLHSYFFPALLVLYSALPHQWRWGLLLIERYYFYMAWKAEYALLMLFSTVLNYGIAIALETSDHRVARHVWKVFGNHTWLSLSPTSGGGGIVRFPRGFAITSISQRVSSLGRGKRTAHEARCADSQNSATRSIDVQIMFRAAETGFLSKTRFLTTDLFLTHYSLLARL